MNFITVVRRFLGRSSATKPQADAAASIDQAAAIEKPRRDWHTEEMIGGFHGDWS